LLVSGAQKAYSSAVFFAVIMVVAVLLLATSRKFFVVVVAGNKKHYVDHLLARNPEFDPLENVLNSKIEMQCMSVQAFDR
jgi:hypothetical protein